MDASRIAKEATRLLPLADSVLKRYDFETRELEHLTTHSNVMYRVVTKAGEQLVLRVGDPQANTRTNIEFEVNWLDALTSETSLDVVHPVHTTSGSLIVDEPDPALGRDRPCVVFSWVPGVPIGDGAGSFGYRLLGQMSASLQRHGRSWQPPNVGQMRRWNRVFYYDPDSDPVVIDDPLYGHLFDTAMRTTIRKAVKSAEQVITEAWAAGEPQVVHGDLHEWNVHVVGSRLYAFDFEDVMLALPAQDIAISLYHSRNDNGQRAELRQAFRRGYEAVLEWPVADERQLDGFHAARQVMLMNYAARALPMKEAEDYLSRVMPWLAGYVRRYG